MSWNPQAPAEGHKDGLKPIASDLVEWLSCRSLGPFITELNPTYLAKEWTQLEEELGEGRAGKPSCCLTPRR